MVQDPIIRQELIYIYLDMCKPSLERLSEDIRRIADKVLPYLQTPALA